MDVRRLMVFRSVAQAGSISAAARGLGLTQPAVSQHLKGLERELGCTLVIRGPGGVDLTEAGRMLLGRAEVVAGQLHMAEEELAALAQLRRGHVRLAVFPSAAATLVPRAVARLERRRRNVDVSLLEAEPPEALELLRDGAVDLALVFAYGGPPVLAEQQLRWVPVSDEPVRLVLPPRHRLARGRGIRLANLSGDLWVAGCERCREHLVTTCAMAGFEPSIRHTTDDYVVVQNLVAAGLGVSLLPRSAVDAYRHPEVVLRSSESFGTRSVGMVHRDGAETVPATAALMRELGPRSPRSREG